MEAVKEQFRKSDKAGGGKISQDALAELIAKLCGDIIPLEVVRSLFQSFDGGAAPGGAINYNDFIEWLFESLEATGGAGGSVTQGLEASKATASPRARSKTQIVPARGTCDRLFLSNQHTAEFSAARIAWLGGCEAREVKASVPPFNIRLELPLPVGCVGLNIATFGVKLPRVIMTLFDSDEMKKLSKDLSIPVPPYALDSFVQKKMPKVYELIAEARKPETGLDEKNLAAVTKLENFCKEFETLNKEGSTKIGGPVQWEEFVGRHVAPGWQDKLHFETVLPENFGFDKSVSEKLRLTTIKVMEKDKETEVTFEHHALRWLTKAFKGYGPVGCLTDLVNLVYAMLQMSQPAEASEQAAIDAVLIFQEHLAKKEFDKLWIPTHLVHDGESDDSLTWLMLEHIHRLMETPQPLQVLIQLPAEEKLDKIAEYLRDHPAKDVQVFRDKDSSNGKAVSQTWSRFIPKEE